MKKVSIETGYNVLKEVGKLFDLKVVGIKAEVLVEQINKEIDALNSKPAKSGKWYENVELPFKEGDIVNVISGWAEGRQIKIVKPSAKVNAFKGQLFNPKTGTPQGTLVGIEMADIELYVPNLPVIVEEQEAI
ncbi:hypothetical protein D3C87_75390 [compost metagenome]